LSQYIVLPTIAIEPEIIALTGKTIKESVKYPFNLVLQSSLFDEVVTSMFIDISVLERVVSFIQARVELRIFLCLLPKGCQVKRLIH